MNKLVDTWSTRASEEDGMTEEHTWIWNEMINATAMVNDLSEAKVLDVGCNQGGFLRLLHDRTGIASGVGVDLAKTAIDLAESRKGARPLRYIATETLSDADCDFDVAYSHEVIYLIDDLADHVTQIASVLKPGGTYHAVTCCHSDSPLWATWRPKIQEFSNIPVPNHSIADIVDAFRSLGFDLAVSRFLASAPIPMEDTGAYFPSHVDRIETYTRWKLMFSATKPG